MKLTIVFDLDGTLVDTAPSILNCLSKALTEYKIFPKVTFDNSLIGPPLAETFRRLCGDLTDEALDDLINAFKRHYDGAGLLLAPAYAGVPQMLETLQTYNRMLHIATNKRLAPSLALLEHLGLRQRFSSVYALDMQEPRFVDKASMLRALLSAYSIDPAATIYVGDREEDANAAAENQIPFIGVTWGYGTFFQHKVAANTDELLAMLLN